jgi:hypothetical protein
MSSLPLTTQKSRALQPLMLPIEVEVEVELESIAERKDAMSPRRITVARSMPAGCPGWYGCVCCLTKAILSREWSVREVNDLANSMLVAQIAWLRLCKEAILQWRPRRKAALGRIGKRA